MGKSRETPSGDPEVEAAHIYPRSENGADDPRNGLALCKLHHWAFDSGWLAVSDDYEILVKDVPSETDTTISCS
ncbi:HNH endonuclease [Halogranum amylolyticum]|uniref:HNH endonuclease n=1 Tax=Halogranum amylolyticum TaxID=660520 RepID=UPI001FCD5229|nr:HNH endonuclease [Halogranum amylolyticum]